MYILRKTIQNLEKLKKKKIQKSLQIMSTFHNVPLNKEEFMLKGCLRPFCKMKMSMILICMPGLLVFG